MWCEAFSYRVKPRIMVLPRNTYFGGVRFQKCDAFKNELPAYIINRRKAGFGMPLRSIFSTDAKVNQLLDKSFFSNFNQFSIPNIEKIISNHISGKEDNSSIIYALISFQEWYKLKF